MNNVFLRSLVIFAFCVVLAVWLGFLIAGPLTYSALTAYGLLAFILVIPLLLRWHYPLLWLCWNFHAAALFVPGRPSVGLTMICLSLGFSLLQRMTSQQHQFIRAPRITVVLLAFLLVVAFTAKLNGFGLRVFGGEVYGGQKYFYLIGSILGYFALSAQRIPPGHRNLYLGLFFLGGISAAVGDLVNFLPRSFYFIFWFFNPFGLQQQTVEGGHILRLNGSMLASMAIFYYMLARYGFRGIFLAGKAWRWMFLMLAVAFGLLGGYRTEPLTLALISAVQFFLERMYRTKLLWIFLCLGFVGAVALVPLAPHLPIGMQRAVSFLPYKISTEAKIDAQNTLDWRLNMWSALLPQIPEYLLLGKGYNINPQDLNFVLGPDSTIRTSAFMQSSGVNDPLAISEAFHNGPISILIPFGIWGAIVFLWFIIVALRVTYLNYRYGDPELNNINAFLLAAIAGHAIFFLLIGGDLSADMMVFCGLLGLSVSFNGGVRKPVRVVQSARQTPGPARFARLRPAPVPAFPRPQPGANR
jgi:hypothetical protein